MTQDIYYAIDPEVTGELDEGQSYDAAQRAAETGPLRVIFEGWLGDDLVATSPFWFVTERLAAAMKEADLTGFELDPMIIATGEQWELSAQFELPAVWLRLIPSGSIEDADDVVLDGELVVSKKALEVLQSFSLHHASVDLLDETTPSLQTTEVFFAQQTEKAKELASEIREPVQERVEEKVLPKPVAPPIPVEPGVIAGDILTLFAALGHDPESKEVANAQALFGVLGDRELTPRSSVHKKDYLTFEYWHSGTMMQFEDDELARIVVRVQPEWGWLPFPHPEKLLHGINAESTREEVRAFLGSTIKTGDTHDCWQIGSHYLDIWYNPRGLLGRMTVLLRIGGN